MVLFLVIILFLIILFAILIDRKIGRLTRRIEELEQRGTALVHTPEEVPSIVPSSREELAKVGIHEGEWFLRAAEPAMVPVSPSEESVRNETVVAKESKSVSQEVTGARWLGRIGAVAVVLGMAFFLKYAFDNNWIGPTGRVALGVLAGIIAIGVGQKLRAKYLKYSDILMACGIGILYLSLYASYGFYHLVTPAIAFFLMGMVTALGMVLSITGGSVGLAVLALLGGFATPILLSTGENHLMTLSIYMIILDCGVFGIAWFKKWVQLNYLSFLGTLILFGGWITEFYTPAQFGETFFFVTIFFSIFLATSVLHHLVRKETTLPSDLILLILNATGYFGVGIFLLDVTYSDLEGFFALILAVLYLAVAYIAYGSNQTDRTMNLFLPGIAITFLTIAVPLQLSGYWISLAWLMEALLLCAVGLYLRERIIQLFGWIVLFVGEVSVIQDVILVHESSSLVTPFLNVGFFLMVVSVLVSYAIAWLYFRLGDQQEKHTRAGVVIAIMLAGIGSAIAFHIDLSLRAEFWQTLPWLVQGSIMLLMGFALRSRIVEGFGWLVAVAGITVMFATIDRVHNGVPQFSSNVPYDPSPFLNLGFLMFLFSIATFGLFLWIYTRNKERAPNWKILAGTLVIIGNIVAIGGISSEIGFVYDRQIKAIHSAEATIISADANYLGGSVYRYENYAKYDDLRTANYTKVTALRGNKDTAISVFWALYAILLVAIGFLKRLRIIRLFGLVFFFVTAIRVFIEIFSRGEQLERIISSIVFGLVALGASFLYVKYQHRLKEIIYE